MSGAATGWAWRQRGLSVYAKVVLARLCDFANHDGECWPSQKRIAEDCCIPRETVNRAIKQLVEAGLIENRPQTKNGAQIVSRYFVRCDGGSHPPVTEDHRVVTPDHTPPVTPDHTEPLLLEPPIEPYPPTPPAGGDAGFSIWYGIYPHKVGKAAALKAFKTARKKTPLEALIQGTHKYVTTKPPDRPWCNPATWLNQQRWLDQPAGLLVGLEPVANASRAPPLPMDPKKLGHSLPCHCGNCLRWAELISDTTERISA